MKEYYTNTERGIRVTISDRDETFVGTGDGVFEEVIGISVVIGFGLFLLMIV